jgi:SAM-dependent methyltransferase
MRHRKSTACAGFAVLVLGVSLAAAQIGQQRRQPDVPYVPTTEEAVRAMLKLADVKRTDIVYDLGCGDGRIVIAAAKTYGARGVGIDIDPDRIREAKENAKKAGVENLVRFEENDLFQADFHDATVVTLFLLRSINLKLRPKLLQELKPGTRVVSNTFDMGDWRPEKEQSLPGADDDEAAYLSHKFFLWNDSGARREVAKQATAERFDLALPTSRQHIDGAQPTPCCPLPGRGRRARPRAAEPARRRETVSTTATPLPSWSAAPIRARSAARATRRPASLRAARGSRIGLIMRRLMDRVLRPEFLGLVSAHRH